MKSWYKKNIYWFWPALFTVVVAVPLVAWLKIDTNLPHWDMGRHLFVTIQYRTLWGEFLSGQKNIFGLLGFYAYYPPIIYNLVLLFYKLFGASSDTAVYSNIVWMFILLFSVFNISKNMWGTKSGLVAMLVILSSPIIIGQFREFQVDLPLTSIFALSLYLFIKAENFTNKKYSLLSGVVAGVGMLVKWTYLAYAGPAAGLFLIFGLMQKDKRKVVLKNLLTAFAIAFLICGYWYLRNFESIGHDFASNGIRVAKIEGDPTGFTKEAFLWYLDKLGMYYLYLPLSVLFVFSLLRIFLSKSKDLLAKSWPFMLLFVVYYLIFSTLPNKDTRYIMPALVPLVIIISTLIAGVKNKILIYSLTMLILFIFILNNVSVAFGKYFDIKNRETILFGSGKLSRFGVVVSDVGGYTSTSPTKNICPLEEIVNIIPAGKMSRLIGDDEMRINNWDLAYFLPKDGRVWSGQGLPVLESDYLIFKDGPRNPVSLDTWDLRSKVTVLNTFTCTDGYKIYLTSVNK